MALFVHPLKLVVDAMLMHVPKQHYKLRLLRECANHGAFCCSLRPYHEGMIVDHEVRCIGHHASWIGELNPHAIVLSVGAARGINVMRLNKELLPSRYRTVRLSRNAHEILRKLAMRDKLTLSEGIERYLSSIANVPMPEQVVQIAKQPSSHITSPEAYFQANPSATIKEARSEIDYVTNSS
jgi:hypothetical protein